MLNWLRCVALTTDIALARGELLRAAALLDSPASSDGHHDQPSVVRMLATRRARLARLSGEFAHAEQHLASAAALEEAPGLGPDRVVYLVEAAHAARCRGLTWRAAALVEALSASSAEVGVVLPLPERRYLDQLAGPASAPAEQS